MAEVRTLKLNLLADVDQFGRGLKQAEGDTQNLTSKIGKYGKQMAAAFAVVAAAAGAMAVKIGVDAIKAASDLNEEMSKAEVIFGDGAKEITAFSKTAAKGLGLTQKAALQGASTFAILGKAAGLTGKDLTGFSIKSTKLASDLGSFFNTKSEDAILAIGSALRGEAEPIRKYGVLLSAASLEQAAFNYETNTGTELTRDSKNQLTETSKVLARYQAILDQTKDAQGDFARTSDGLANQQKILAASVENLKASFGTSLLPTMVKVVQAANQVAEGFAGNNSNSLSARAIELGASVGDRGAFSLGQSLARTADAFSRLFAEITSDDAENAPSVLQSLANGINAVANAIDSINNAYQKALPALRFIQNPFNLNIPEAGFTPRPKGRPKGLATGGSVSGGGAYRVGEFGPEMFVPSGSGSIRKDTGGGGGNTFILNGIIDAESARRSIERILQQSSRRTGAINLVGGTL